MAIIMSIITTIIATIVIVTVTVTVIVIVIVIVIVSSSQDPVKVIFAERLFKSMADQLALGGWREAGYDTIIMDDCWLAPQR